MSEPCPLCLEREAELVERVRFDDVWHALAEQWGVSFSPGVRDRHQATAELELKECAGCGLQRFEPAIPGDASFYEELMAATPYEAVRWEFGVVADRLGAGDAVVDFGCGDGAFLRSLGPRAGRIVGVDHNEAAIADLRGAGVEAHAEPFDRFAAREREAFDVACAFQIVEHLPRVEALVGPMAGSVGRGGRLFVSVPNRDRSFRWGSEPLDCPPHHLTRWAPEQLDALAERFGLRLVTTWRQPPTLGEARALSVRSPESPLGRLLAHARMGPYRYRRAVRSGRFERRGLFGHTMLAELEKPR